MDAETSARTRAQNLDEIWKWTVGAGILVVALAPLALPILILTIVATLPLVLPVLAVGLLLGVVALPILALRKAARSLRRIRPRRGPAEPARQPVAGY
jgi:hypothetical protein